MVKCFLSMLISRDAACYVRLKNAPRRMPRKQIFCSATPLADTACFAPLRLPRLSGESNLQRGWHSFGFILAYHPPTSSKPKPIELALIAEASQMFSMRSMINLKSQISNLKSQISNLKPQTSNLKPQTYSTYSTFTASPLRISAKACGLMVTGPFINSGML